MLVLLFNSTSRTELQLTVINMNVLHGHTVEEVVKAHALL